MATVSGPLFHSDAQVEGMLHEIRQDVAQRGYELVQGNLAGSLRHPTGYYQSQVRVEDTPRGRAINDGGVVYGPWLEGVGSRNETTRFKGYFSFRRATQTLESEAPAIAQRIVAQFIQAVN